MSEITLFENPQFGKVRVIMRGNELWFVAKDVCDCLDIRTCDALPSLDDDEKQLLTGEQFAETKSLCTPDIIGGQENSGSPALTICPPSGLNIISDSGFYSLVLRSRKPEAKAFKRWVAREIFNNPILAARAWAAEYEAKQKAQAALAQEQSVDPRALLAGVL